MGAIDILGPMIGLAAVAAVILVAVAIIQDLRHDKKYGYRQAFYTIVSLVGLLLSVASFASVMTITMKATVLPKAESRSGDLYPPSLPFITQPACTTTCSITADEKNQFASWKNSFTAWRATPKAPTTGLTQALRTSLASSLAVLIVSLPLYFFFARLMNHGAAEELKAEHRPSPLRSVYFYGIALAGLIMAVVSASILINTGLKRVLKTDSTDTSNVAVSTAKPTYETTSAQAIIDCAGKCSFSAEDVTLVQDWKTASEKAGTDTNYSSTQSDLASMIPLLLLGAPLFWFHFARIRKETSTS